MPDIGCFWVLLRLYARHKMHFRDYVKLSVFSCAISIHNCKILALIWNYAHSNALNTFNKADISAIFSLTLTMRTFLITYIFSSLFSMYWLERWSSLTWKKKSNDGQSSANDERRPQPMMDSHQQVLNEGHNQ